jgi:hypothetical protein
MRLGIVAPIERPGQSELDGSFYAWVNPGADGPASGDYPLVFDCPDAAMHDDLELPCVMPVQLAGFAHHLEIWDSVAEFDAARGGDDTQLASRAFIPAGLLRAEGVEDPPPPVAYAIINGHVLAAEVRENPLTGVNYQWAALATHGGTLDVVAPMGLVTREIREGSVLSGGSGSRDRSCGRTRRRTRRRRASCARSFEAPVPEDRRVEHGPGASSRRSCRSRCAGRRPRSRRRRSCRGSGRRRTTGG